MIAGFLVVASLVITGATIWYISRIPVSTPLLVLTITDYADPIPPNAWAEEDFHSFYKAWPSTADDGFRLYPFRLPKTTHNVVMSDNSQIWRPGNVNSAKSDLLKLIEKLKPGGPEEKRKNGRGAVVIYVSGHGVLDKQGRPCLLLPYDASNASFNNTDVGLPYLDDDRRLPLEDLLTAIRDKLPASAHKLVVLDCHRIDLHFGLGILYNDFARRTEELIRTSAPTIPNLAVLTSAGSDQVGWSSVPLRHSVFGENVRLGLLGKADADKNDRVTVTELAAFVRDQTDRWVNRNCSDGQRPMLIPDKVDFELAFVSNEQPSTGAAQAAAPTATADSKPTGGAPSSVDAAATASSPQADWAEVDRLWEFVQDRSPWDSDDLVNHRTARRFSVWESLRVGLIRLEQLKMSGSAYSNQAKTLQHTLSQTADALTKSAMDPTKQPIWHGLRAMQYWGDLKPVGQLPPLPGDGKSDPNASEVPYHDRVSQAWRWALTTDFDIQHLETHVRKYVNFKSDPKQQVPLEFHFLSQLDRLSRTAKNPSSVDRIKALLRCREAAEIAASGDGDERVIYWSRQSVDKADETRRQAEDRLFSDEWADSDTKIQEATAIYAAATARAAQLSHAVRTRNRAWADLPHYARWLSRRPHRQSAASDVERELIPQLHAVIRNNATLSRRWEELLRDQLSAAGDNWTDDDEFKQGFEEVIALTKKVEAGLEVIDTAFRNAVADAVRKTDNVVAWREASDLLAIPLVKSLDRQTLRTRVLEQRPQAVDSKGSLSEPTPYEKQWAARWEATGHPIVELLNRRFLESTSTADLGAPERPAQVPPAAAAAQPADEAKLRDAVESLTKQGETVTKEMRRLIVDVNTWMDTPTPTDLPTWFTQRSPRSQAERLFRVGTGLLPSSLLGSGSLEDPIRRLQEFDLHHLAAWHGLRVADDFWGSGTRAYTPYFDVAGKAYHSTAKRLPPTDSRIYHELDRRLEDRRKAAEVVLKPTIDADLGSQQPPDYVVDFLVAQSPAAPRGRSTFYVVEKSGTPDTRRGVDMTGGPKPTEQKLTFTTTAAATAPGTTGGATSASPERTLVGFWRGHVREANLKIDEKTPDGEFVFRPRPNQEATVIVKGRDVEPGTVAIIFDCSASMENKLGGVTRMVAARDAVTGIAKALAAVGNYRVSLWFYGNRAGFQDEPLIPIMNPKRPELVANAVHPGEDVEKVWSGILKEGKELDDLTLKINQAGSFGVTPLFLSMEQAIDVDLRNAPPTAARHLIVITDGKNEDGSNNPKTKPPKSKSASDVVSLLQNDAKRNGKSIKVDIISCGDAGEIDYFRKSLTAPGVTPEVQSATDQTQLKKGLAEALNLYDYDVTAVKAATRAAGPEPMNKQVTIRGLRRGEPIRHRAALLGGYTVSSDFALEGGELIELALDARQSGDMRLIHQRYKGPSGWLRPEATAQVRVPDEVLRAKSAGSFLPSTYFVGAGTPEKSKDEFGPCVVFPITIQNGDPESFSPRPAEVWVEVTPLVDNQAIPDARPYAVYDVSYQPDLPAPVLECKVRGWPQAARGAEIRLWWKPERATVKLVRKLDIATNTTEPMMLDLGSGSTANFKATVTSTADGVEVQIRERRDRASTGENDLPIRVEIDGVGRDADLIRRSYSRDGRTTEHRFLFGGEVESKVLAYDLKISSAQEAKAGAVTLPSEKQTLKVRLPQQ